LVLKFKNIVARFLRTYRELQERVALKRRVRNNWVRIRTQRQWLVSSQRSLLLSQRSLLRRLAGNVSTTVQKIARGRRAHRQYL